MTDGLPVVFGSQPHPLGHLVKMIVHEAFTGKPAAVLVSEMSSSDFWQDKRKAGPLTTSFLPLPLQFFCVLEGESCFWLSVNTSCRA